MKHTQRSAMAAINPTPSYLDDLPEDGLRNLLRRLSLAPSAPFWLSLVKPKDLLTSVHPSSRLSTVARDHFKREFAVSFGAECSTVNRGTDWMDSEFLLETGTIPARLIGWIDESCKSLTQLSLSICRNDTTLHFY